MTTKNNYSYFNDSDIASIKVTLNQNNSDAGDSRNKIINYLLEGDNLDTLNTNEKFKTLLPAMVEYAQSGNLASLAEILDWQAESGHTLDEHFTPGLSTLLSSFGTTYGSVQSMALVADASTLQTDLHTDYQKEFKAAPEDTDAKLYRVVAMDAVLHAKIIESEAGTTSSPQSQGNIAASRQRLNTIATQSENYKDRTKGLSRAVRRTLAVIAGTLAIAGALTLVMMTSGMAIPVVGKIAAAISKIVSPPLSKIGFGSAHTDVICGIGLNGAGAVENTKKSREDSRNRFKFFSSKQAAKKVKAEHRRLSSFGANHP